MAMPGPRKLVLIDSGTYPYAEIDLEESVHLSGQNNAGKTSLLNALQFLYIDDIKLMHFPNTNFQGKTKPFYFKASGRSTILVEADTKWGIRTVGFHGLGAAAGCDWQRFGFDGPYLKDDFVDPVSGDPRPWDEVKLSLAGKNYVELSQAQLRAALRGSGEKNAFRLELVPGGGRYDTFIEVFRQLLTLRKSKPDDLKHLLISVIEEELLSGDERNRGIVSLTSVVGDDYTRAFAANQRYERIRSGEKGCANLFLDYDKLAQLHTELPDTLRLAYGEATARLRDRKRKAEEARSGAEEAREQEGAWTSQRRSLDDSIDKQNKRIGQAQGKLEDLQVLAERLGSEPKALLEGRLADLKEEAARIRMDLSAFQGVVDGSGELRARASKHRQSRQAMLDTAQRLRAMDEPGAKPSWMDLLAEYPEEERSPLLKLLNPALLSLPEGKDGLEVLDPGVIGRVVSGVALASRDGFFTGGGIRVNLSALSSPLLELDDPIVRSQEIEKYEAQAQQHEREATRLEELADSSRSREGLQKKLDTLESEERELSRKSFEIAGWEEQIQELPALEEALTELEAECRRQKDARENAIEQHEQCQTLARTQETRSRALAKEIQQLQEDVLHVLEQQAMGFGLDLFPEDVTQEAPAMEDAAFAAALKQAAADWEEAIRLDKSVERRLEEVEVQLEGMIAGDRETKIGMLRDLIEGLPDQKAQLDAAWQHIAVTAKTSFSNLLRDFETLDARVKRLNRAMAKFAVSNLSNIQLQLVPNLSRMNILKQFTQEQGLFLNAGLAERAQEQVGDWIKQGEVFRLFDLFRIELEVFKDGEKEVYASLDAESTGTAVTLKVIFLAHLLRDLFRSRTDVRLLIFVDEVDTLDDVNQETIRECARELGFVMIMASPNPANARRLYFLRREGKLTYIYPEESLEVVFKDEPEVENVGQGEEADEFEAVSAAVEDRAPSYSEYLIPPD